MEVFYITIISILGFLLIYLFIRNQVVGLIDQKIKILYKEKIASDVQDIYRELENYSSIIDSRIVRLKTLTERHESALKIWENIQKELKKSKTGKEVLSFIEDHEFKSALKPEDITLMKKEITDDIKAFISKKLNLAQDVPMKPQTTKIKTANLEEKPKPPIEDANIAELIIQEMDRETVIKRPKQTATPEPPLFIKNNPVEEKKQSNTTDSFFNILGSMGKALSPLFLKTESSTAEKSFSTAKRNVPEKSFNDLIKKEMQSPVIKPAESPQISEPVSHASPSQKIMEPEELIRLLEELKNSRLRPIALKHLLTHGFQLNQIAEISNIPFSDLELTKNLYNIQPDRVTP